MGLIFLTGMPGAGKSTIGKLLANEMKLQCVDLDREIERRRGMSIEDIFSREGEAIFRDLESSALEHVCRLKDGVVALGAGALERDENFARVIASGILIYLRMDIDTLVKRNLDTASRPLLAGALSKAQLRERLEKLLSNRSDRYLAASIIVDCGHNEPEQVTVETVLAALSNHVPR